MLNTRMVNLLGLFTLIVAPSAWSQVPSSKNPPAPGLVKLTGDDERRAKQLQEQIDQAMEEDRWDEAISRAEELLALRARVQGAAHFETVDADWQVKTLRWAAVLPKDERAAVLSARGMSFTASLYAKFGDDGMAMPLEEKALEIRRRLLGDDHPDTTVSYHNLAVYLVGQGQFAAAQPLCEKSLEIRRRLLGDEHPDTAASYSSLAILLMYQGRYAAAQPLCEQAMEVRRRLLGDDHPATAASYSTLAADLAEQGKYAAAQPLYEKALEILRLLKGDRLRTPHTYSYYHVDLINTCCNLAENLNTQGKYVQAQPHFEKALEVGRRFLGDDHPDTAQCYNHIACNLDAQGQYAAAQPLHEKALEIRRRLLTDDHPDSATSYGNLGANLHAQGRYVEARDQWLRAVKGVDAARLRVAFTGLERAVAVRSPRPALAAVLARLARPAEAWQTLEEDLGRGLLDELTARRGWRLSPAERARLRELTTELEKLDKFAESSPKDPDQAERVKRLAEVRRQRELASIALGEFQTKLVKDYGPRAGQVAALNAIQAALPAHTALIAWVDIPPVGPNAADPDGEHWGMVVRSRGIPAWVPIAGTGPDGLWTKDDTGLAERVRTELRGRPGAGTADPRPLLEKLRTQRLEPFAKALGSTADGLPTARRLIVLPSRAMAAMPVEALLAAE